MAAALFPPCAEQVTVFFGHAVGDGKSEICSDGGSVFCRIRSGCKNTGTDFRERSTAFFIALEEPSAKGSPMSAIEEDDCVVRLNRIRQRDLATVRGFELHLGEGVHEVKLVSQFICLLQFFNVNVQRERRRVEASAGGLSSDERRKFPRGS